MENFTIIHYGHFRSWARTWSYLNRHWWPVLSCMCYALDSYPFARAILGLFWKCALLEHNIVVKSGHALRVDLIL